MRAFLGAIGNQPFASTASRKALLASQALRATLCVLSAPTKGSLYIRNGQVPHIRTSTAGKHPARVSALRANTLRAPTRCGPTPCARQYHLKGEESSLGVLSGEKPGKGQERQLGERGGARLARAALSPLAPYRPPLAQDVRGQGDRAQPRRHARLASRRRRCRDGLRGGESASKRRLR